MAVTGSNRGWGGTGSEQVDSNANLDFKQVFDCGFTLNDNDSIAAEKLSFYAPNLWPDNPVGFSYMLKDYYVQSVHFALKLLCSIVSSMGEDSNFFVINLLALWHYYEGIIIPNSLHRRLTRILGLQRTPTMGALHSWRQTDHWDWRCVNMVVVRFHCQHRLVNS